MTINTIPKLFATKNSISLSIVIFMYLLILVANVKSDSSFNFPNFQPEALKKLGFANDATLKNGVIQLTKKDAYGDPLKHSAGQFGLLKPIRLFDQTTGKVASFITEFTFSVNSNGRQDHGDGFAFFMASPKFKIPNKNKSEGGFLGMFTRETALYTKEIVLVEFDSFANEWDPNPSSNLGIGSHLGIDVNSIKSVANALWLNDFDDITVGKARIEYDSSDKNLKVLVTYSEKGAFNGDSSLVYNIDLTTFLPEMIEIGFSASTGDLVETHDILSWSFTSNM